MTDTSIKPEKITRPIQLLAAWLAGLLAIDSCFLFAAANLQQGSWESGALTIAAICNVPLFLIAVFLLQTKYRPELQEDSYYSTYLSRKTNEPIKIQEPIHQSELRYEIAALEKKVTESAQIHTKTTRPRLDDLKIGVNRHLGDKAEIQKALADAGVIGTAVFGTDEIPEYRVVAISKYLSRETTKELVRIARELSFDGYSLFDDALEDTTEQVLFGAYGNVQFEIVG